MKKWPVEYLSPDMVTARTVVHNGRVMLNKGTQLTARYIERLKQLGFRSIYVQDSTIEKKVLDLVTEKTRLDALRSVTDCYTALQKNLQINVQSVRSSVDYIMDEVLANRNVLVNLVDIRSHDDYLFAHGVNVSILAIATGATLGYNQLMLKDLGVGAILHDVGMTNVDTEVLHKPSNLTKEEAAQIKEHPWHGFETLRALPGMSLFSAHVALQHHERWGGGGYPRNMSGEEIHEYARIVSVADVFDALVSDRPYRLGYTISQALYILSQMGDAYFDPRILKAFSSKIALFPIGSMVVLNTGEKGIVVDTNTNYPNKPVVKIIVNNNNLPLKSGHEVDLSKLDTVFVTGIETDEIPGMKA